MHIYYIKAILKNYNIKGNNNKKKNQLKINFIIILLLNLHQSLIEGLKITSNLLKTFTSQKKNLYQILYLFWNWDVLS